MESLRLLIRKRYGSYRALGQEIGITTQAVYSIVKGHTTSATARYAVAHALGFKVSDLWPETEEKGAA